MAGLGQFVATLPNLQARMTNLTPQQRAAPQRYVEGQGLFYGDLLVATPQEIQAVGNFALRDPEAVIAATGATGATGVVGAGGVAGPVGPTT